ncbi:DUF6417 family protein [Streptomyces pini]|uniref:DUF6417 family protein n=1 Tax=Streptomyces pini TaxID=1520580 RepID=UPI003CCB8EE9
MCRWPGRGSRSSRVAARLRAHDVPVEAHLRPAANRWRLQLDDTGLAGLAHAIRLEVSAGPVTTATACTTPAAPHPHHPVCRARDGRRGGPGRATVAGPRSPRLKPPPAHRPVWPTPDPTYNHWRNLCTKSPVGAHLRLTSTMPELLASLQSRRS